MNHQTSIFYIILSLLVLGSVFSCTNNSTSVNDDVGETVITFSNSGAQSYLITSIEGEGVDTEINAANPELTLTEGRRYTIINEAGASSHPLDFRNSEGDKLFGQSNNSGIFNSSDSVNIVRNGDSITFTLTHELADKLADYICSFHPGMNGAITVN